jgi:hypothetical protein
VKAIPSIFLLFLFAVNSYANIEESKIADQKAAGNNLSPMPMNTVMDFRGRFDWLHTENKATTGTSKDSEFQTQYLRILTDGKVNETTKFSLILRPLESSKDGYLIENALVTKKFSEHFSYLIGKQPALIGGRENDYADYDLFLISLVKNSLPLANSPGLSIQYEAAGQSVYFQALKGLTNTKSVYIYGITYYGSFLDGKISPIISYHQEPTDISHAKNKYYAVGTQFVSGTTILELDWLRDIEEKNGPDNKDDITTSMIFHLKYNHETFKPFAKLILDKVKNSTSTTTSATSYDRTGWEVGAQFHPAKDEDLHYHVVYNSAETSEKFGGTASTTVSTITVGATFSFNILK